MLSFDMLVNHSVLKPLVLCAITFEIWGIRDGRTGRFGLQSLTSSLTVNSNKKEIFISR